VQVGKGRLWSKGDVDEDAFPETNVDLNRGAD
jgi:hypothetical protein